MGVGGVFVLTIHCAWVLSVGAEEDVSSRETISDKFPSN